MLGSRWLDHGWIGDLVNFLHDIQIIRLAILAAHRIVTCICTLELMTRSGNLKCVHYSTHSHTYMYLKLQTHP